MDKPAKVETQVFFPLIVRATVTIPQDDAETHAMADAVVDLKVPFGITFGASFPVELALLWKSNRGASVKLAELAIAALQAVMEEDANDARAHAPNVEVPQDQASLKAQLEELQARYDKLFLSTMGFKS